MALQVSSHNDNLITNSTSTNEARPGTSITCCERVSRALPLIFSIIFGCFALACSFSCLGSPVGLGFMILIALASAVLTTLVCILKTYCSHKLAQQEKIEPTLEQPASPLSLNQQFFSQKVQQFFPLPADLLDTEQVDADEATGVSSAPVQTGSTEDRDIVNNFEYWLTSF